MPSTEVPQTPVPVTELQTKALEKLRSAINRGHHLPVALKGLSDNELRATREAIDAELANRSGGSAALAHRPPSRAWTPSTA